MKTTGKATGNTCDSNMTRICAATPFCVVDMPSRPLTWSITPRHDMYEMW